MGNSKIVYYGETLIDLTGDTVEAAKLLKGITAHDKKGEKITGTLADVTQATPAITVDAAGKITASATQAAGVVAAGTKSATKQLTVQAAKTVTPSASAQTAVAKGVFTTGIVTVAAVYAVIGVTYPAGSTVTCTNGSKTLRAKDTTGKALFVIPFAGTWTVKAVKGSQSASKAVSITVEGQVETVTLAYFSATIKVTYPAKSTCVIKNSSGTQVGSDTNTGTAAKTWTATVGATGTYTITATATDGSGKTKSTTVSITTNGQNATVKLTYRFYIFKNGSGLTSGYSIESSSNNIISAPTVSNDTISWSGDSDGGGIAICIKPAVALASYTKLCVDFECSYNYGDDYGMGFGVGTDAVLAIRISWVNWTAKVTSTAQGKIARNTVQCDISALTDSEYIKIVGSYSAGKVYNIWLE